MKNILPTEIRRLDTAGLRISWSDGAVHEIASETLRRRCPCATCREERGESSHAAPLTPKKPSLLRVIEATRDEQIRLTGIWSIGHYAIGVRWADGHDTGIYTYDYLFALGEAPSDGASPAAAGR